MLVGIVSEAVLYVDAIPPGMFSWDLLGWLAWGAALIGLLVAGRILGETVALSVLPGFATGMFLLALVAVLAGWEPIA